LGALQFQGFSDVSQEPEVTVTGLLQTRVLHTSHQATRRLFSPE